MNETSTQRRAGRRSRHDRAADALQSPPNLAEAADTGLRSGRIWGLVGLLVLTGATSLVVATISAWLVPVYVAAMVLIFATPRPQKAADPTPPPSSSDEVPATVSPEAAAGVVMDEAGVVENGEPTSPAESAAEPTPSKPRKKRGKGKRAAKAAALAEASSQPTWIRVGPGKFVRADVQAEPPADTENPTQSEDAPPADPESMPEREAVESPTLTEATPAEACPEESDESSPDESTDAFEAAPMESDEEYGNAPSALAGPFDEEYGNAPSALADPFDEEYGNAPSALAETWEPEALPEAFADDEPTPAVEDDRRDDVQEEARFEEPSGTPAAHAGPSTAIASMPLGRPTPLGVSTVSLRASAKPVGRDAIRRPAPRRGRPGRPHSRRTRNASSGPMRSSRTVRVRPRASDRGRRRSDATGRRPHPRSPPRRD